MPNPTTLGRLTSAVSLTLALAYGAAACAVVHDPASPDPSSDGTVDLVADASFCVDQINLLRGTVGLAAVRNSADVGVFSAEAARVDGDAHEAHKYFHQTNGGDGASDAENEIPWWLLSRYGSVHEIVRQGLALEWAEGPGGGHYENMTGRYTEAACGISIKNGEVTISQDFR